jgi:hypothetical protein
MTTTRFRSHLLNSVGIPFSTFTGAVGVCNIQPLMCRGRMLGVIFKVSQPSPLCHTRYVSSSIVANMKGYLLVILSMISSRRLFSMLKNPHLSWITWRMTPFRMNHKAMALRRGEEFGRSFNFCRRTLPQSLATTPPPWIRRDWLRPVHTRAVADIVRTGSSLESIYISRNPWSMLG